MKQKEHFFFMFIKYQEMGITTFHHLQLNSHCLASSLLSSNFTPSAKIHNRSQKWGSNVSFSRGRIRAASTLPETESENEPPAVNFAFVHSVLLPDGTPDVHFRVAPGGQKLRDIMMDTNIELYGPYSRILLNCAGGGICGTCMVEVITGKELLNPRTECEKEKLKRKPKNWRLACQTTVGKPDSTGLVTIQQLPEWKGHEWGYQKVVPKDSD